MYKQVQHHEGKTVCKCLSSNLFDPFFGLERKVTLDCWWSGRERLQVFVGWLEMLVNGEVREVCLRFGRVAVMDRTY